MRDASQRLRDLWFIIRNNCSLSITTSGLHSSLIGEAGER